MNNYLVLRYVITLLIGGSLVVFSTAPALADDTDDVVKKLLKDYWSPTKKRDTDSFFAKQTTKNAKTVYAFALVKSRQHDVNTALLAIEKLEDLDPGFSQPQRLKTWLLLRQDKFNLAVTSLAKFIELVKADKKLGDFDKTEAYRFAGRVFAFLEGPAKGKVNAGAIETTKRKILFKLDADLNKAFAFDYSVVQTEYRKLTGQKKIVDSTAAKVDAEKRKVKFAQLTEVEKQLSENQNEIAAKSGELRDEAKQLLDDIRQRDAPFALQQSQLEAELGIVNRELVLLISDYNYWNTLALRENDLAVRNLYFRRAGRIDGQILRVELDAASLRSQVNAIASERDQLRRQYAAIESNASQQLASLNNGLRTIAKQKKRTANEKVKTTKPSRKIITHSVSLKTKARSIVTYEQFPLEIERQLLLDSLK